MDAEGIFDPSRFRKLTMDQKRELVREMSKWPDEATEILQSWTRHDLLQILCAELGKERKSTGLTKSKIIEQLLKAMHEKKSKVPGPVNVSLENGERTSKRQRKFDHLVNPDGDTTIDLDFGPISAVCCKNLACRAKLNDGDEFCKRCSCCICRQYDDNKDPGLWLICNTDPPFHGVSCGMSCHLECALRHENSGISQDKGLDGSFCCVSCGKINDLLSSWRKQIVVARDTRRVDILCYRLSLGQKILAGTKHYQNLYGIIDEAVKKLEEEVGPLTGLPVKKARGIVNRLSSGPEIQKLCASAVESLDLLLSNRVSDMPSGCNSLASKLVCFEDIGATSITVNLNSDDSNVQNVVGYSLWQRKADDADYPVDPTCRLFKPKTKFLLSGLSPATQYFLKVGVLNTDREVGFHEYQFQTGTPQGHALRNTNSKGSEVETSQSRSSFSNPSSVDDLPIIASNKESSEDQTIEKNTGGGDDDNGPLVTTGLECIPYVDSSEANLPITPCKFENLTKDGNAGKEPQAGSSSKKRSGANRDVKCNGIGDKDFEYYVKVVRWLECEGHMENCFRKKFLTWYSLRATPQEVRVVKVFIDTFVEDPESLTEQLVDTFSDVIDQKRCSRGLPSGFCMKLWH